VGQVTLPVAVGTVAAVGGAGGVLGATGVVISLSMAAVFGGLGARTSTPRRSAAGTSGAEGADGLPGDGARKGS
jgi:hypothetical protein